MDLLNKLQQSLVIPKGQWNEFGGFNYRSCDDILRAVKPLLANDGVIRLTDYPKEVCGKVYIVATASLYEKVGGKWVLTAEATSQAREDESRKKMNPEQLSGSASSYARKYALGGLLGLDDEKDSDATNKFDKEQNQSSEKTAVSGWPIDDVEEKTGTTKSGPKKGEPYTMYIIHSGNEKFRTFKKEHADVAMDASGGGLKCHISYTVGKYGNEINGIEPVFQDDIPY
ncbi:MAG: ERF family protein [Desulfobacteraceae bacterium]|jgi:hypothetical protein